MNIVPRHVYSQEYQDGIIESIFKEIGTTNKFCVEFGFDSTTVIGGGGANTAKLLLEEGWTGLLLDGGRENTDINLHRVVLTPENIVSVFDEHGVPTEADYVSIDVDSIDLWLLRALLMSQYRPRVVSVEYNSNFDAQTSMTVRLGTTWQNQDKVYGASLLALCRVAQEFGYKLVAVECGLDAFFVRGDLCPNESDDIAQFAEMTAWPKHREPTPERAALFEAYPCA